MLEVIHIAGGDGDAVTFGRGREEAFDSRDFTARSFGPGLQFGPDIHFPLAERNHAPGKGG